MPINHETGDNSFSSPVNPLVMPEKRELREEFRGNYFDNSDPAAVTPPSTQTFAYKSLASTIGSDVRLPETNTPIVIAYGFAQQLVISGTTTPIGRITVLVSFMTF